MKQTRQNKAPGIRVDKKTLLLEFLLENKGSLSRNKVKSMLRYRQWRVNGTPQTRHDLPLEPGDIVSLVRETVPQRFYHPKLKILFEDHHLLVVDKKEGLLSIATDRQETKTAYRILSDHVKKSDPDNKVFVVHRLDRETSGVMLFARSEEVKESLQKNWKDMVLNREYVAVAEGIIEPAEGVIDVPLEENKNLKVYATPTGKLKAETVYSTIRAGRDHTMVRLSLRTGRKNQIRAHLEYIGHPIAGDKKYGSKTSPAGRVCLHARLIEFIHPVTNERMRFESPVPDCFKSIIK